MGLVSLALLGLGRNIKGRDGMEENSRDDADGDYISDSEAVVQ